MYLYAAFMVSVYFVFSWENNSRWKYLIPLIFIINPYFLNINLWSGGVNILKNPVSMIGEAQASSAAVLMSVFVLLFALLVSKISRDDIKKKILAASVLCGVIVLAAASFSLVTSGGYFQNLYLKEASNARPIVWELSKESIKERPWFGWGGDNFDRSFEKHYNNTILEQKNGAEPWFDRAHNIFIDQTVETGYLGLVSYIFVYISISGALIYVLLKSREKKHKLLATILIVYFGGHIMELQTAFDTTISYVSLVIMAGLASSVFSQTYRIEVGEKSHWSMPKILQYVLGVVLIVFLVFSFFIGTVPIIRSNYTNGAIRMAGSSEKRLPMYNSLFSSPVDRATFLWKSSNDFQRGVAEKPVIIEDNLKREGLIKELSVYTEEYRKYANMHPVDYRIRVTLAGVYIYERLLGVDHLNEAHDVLDDAISISPQIPQAYWMKSVAYLYQRKFDLAREWAKRGYDLNPNIEQSKKIVDYIERSIKTFPEIDFYTFGQI
jgi:tetratricopeptide (TPR) repeat protein